MGNCGLESGDLLLTQVCRSDREIEEVSAGCPEGVAIQTTLGRLTSSCPPESVFEVRYDAPNPLARLPAAQLICQKKPMSV